MKGRKILIMSIVFAISLVIAVYSLTCSGGGSGGSGNGGNVGVAPTLESMTVVRKGSNNEDTDNVMCLALDENNKCESLVLTYTFKNTSKLSIYSITVNGKLFNSSDFRVNSSPQKVVLDYTPDVNKSGDYTIKTEKILYSSGSTQKGIADLKKASLDVKIAPVFTITFDMSESALDENTTDTVNFMSKMENVAGFLDYAQMETIGEDCYGKEGYGFDGWYTEPNGEGDKFTIETVYDYYTDMTLYAHYEKLFTYDIVGDGEDAYAVITGISATGKNRTIIAITDSYDGVPVKEIGANALIGASNAVTIQFNPNLIKIGDGACQGLNAEFIFNDKIEEIGSGAFKNCKGFGNFTLPKTLKTIGNYAFSGCTWNYSSTKKNVLIIPTGVEYLGTGAFKGSKFEKVYFETKIVDEVKIACAFDSDTFGESVFEDSLALKELYTSAIIGSDGKITEDDVKGLNYIGKSAFKGCTALEKLSLAEGLVTISESAFSGNTKKITSLLIPDSLQTIGENAFGNSGLNSITFKGDGEDAGLNSHLYTIGDYAFQSCEFGNTPNTYSVDIRARSLQHYGIAPFFANTKLTVIKLLTVEVPEYVGKECTYRDGGTYTKYYVPKVLLSGYKNLWKIQTNYSGIWSYANYSAELPISPREDIVTDNNNRIYALTINSDGLTATLETIFASNTGYENQITIPSSLMVGAKNYTITAIGTYVAHSNVQSIIFEAPANILKINDYAFAGCENLSVTFDKLISLEYIGECAFYKTKVTSFVSGSDSLNYIGKNAFYLCKSLNTVKIVIGNAVQIDDYAFCYSGVVNVILGDKVKYIENGAFCYCDSLSNVYIQRVEIFDHKNDMTIGVFRSSATEESVSGGLKIYFVNSTAKSNFSCDYYYVHTTSGDIKYDMVGSTASYNKYRNFYKAYKDNFYVDAEKVNTQCS